MLFAKTQIIFPIFFLFFLLILKFSLLNSFYLILQIDCYFLMKPYHKFYRPNLNTLKVIRKFILNLNSPFFYLKISHLQIPTFIQPQFQLLKELNQCFVLVINNEISFFYQNPLLINLRITSIHQLKFLISLFLFQIFHCIFPIFYDKAYHLNFQYMIKMHLLLIYFHKV